MKINEKQTNIGRKMNDTCVEFIPVGMEKLKGNNYTSKSGHETKVRTPLLLM